jgi:hypothetical protein
MDSTYVAVVVVVQFVNQRVTRVLEEKVDDMPDIEGIDVMEGVPAEEGDDMCDMSIFISMLSSGWDRRCSQAG